MGGKNNSTLLSRLKRTLAYYPLTMYFGVFLLALSGIFFWLYLRFGFQLDLRHFTNWLVTHQTPLLLLAAALLSFTLIGSAVAYRQVANLSKEDYVIWLQQRSTRTFFPFFVPLHDWFRLRFALYRWWHTQVFASTIHVILLIVFVIFSANAVTTQVRQQTLISTSGLCGVGGGDGAVHDGNWFYALGLLRPAYAAGALDTFVVSGIPTNTVGSANSVTVEAKDCDGLRMTSYVGTAHFTSSDGSATLPSNYTFLVGDAGIHTFTDGVTFATVGTQSVTVNDVADPTAVGSQTGIIVNSADAATLEVTGITDPVVAGTASNVVVTAKTAGGATATGYTGTVTFTSSDGSATLPSNYTFTGGDAGVHTFTGGVTMKTVGEKTVTATDTVTGSITGTQSAITVTPAAAATLSVSGIFSPVVAGTARSVTVTAKDAYNNTATGYTGIVTFTSSDTAATLPANYTFLAGDNGTKTFTNEVTLKTVGSRSVTATDTVTGSITGTQSNITVNPGVAATLTVTGITDPVTAGTASNAVVTALDAYSNTATGYTGTITFTSNDAQATLPSNYTFVGGDVGTHTFTSGVTMKTAGEKTVTATDTVTGSITGTQSNITVNPAAAATLTVTGITDPVVAGTASNAVVTALDAYSNTATGYTGTVTFTSTDAQATLPSNYAFVGGDAGVHTFTGGVTLKTVGEQSVTATDTVTGSITGSQTSITVTPGAAATLTVAGITDPITAGTASNVVVTALDAYSNTATGYTGTVAFTSTDAQATLPSNYTFVGGDAGVHTFTGGVTPKTAGEQSVTATDTVTGSITGTQSNITVNPGAAASLLVNGIVSPIVAGSVRTVVVTAQDAYSNTATGYTGTVAFTSSDAAATLPANYLFVGGDAGTHTFTNSVTLVTAGTHSVTATDTVTSSITGSQTSITVVAGAATNLLVSGVVTPVIAGTARSATVRATDGYGNTAGTYAGTVRFTSSDGQASLPGTYTFLGSDNGVHTFGSLVVLKTAGSQSLTATDTVTGSITGTQSSITVIAGSASTLLVNGIPSPLTAGDVSSVTVTAKDPYSNTATSYTGTVHFTSSDAQAALPANYTFISGDSGSHSFSSAITLKTAGTQSVTATDVGEASITGSQTGIVVNPGSASQLFLTDIASSVTAGAALSPTVTLKDAYNNVATSYSGTVSFTSTDAQATLPVNHTYRTSELGAHTFTGELKLKTAGSKTVTATDASLGLSSVVSVTVNPGDIASYQVSATSPQVVNVGWTETVTAKDAYGNTVSALTANTTSAGDLRPSSIGSAKFYSSATYTDLVTSYQLSAGLATLYVKDGLAEIMTLTVTDDLGVTGFSGKINVKAAAGGGGIEPCDPDASDCTSGGGGSTGGGTTSETEPGTETTPPDVTLLQQIKNFLAANEPAINLIRKIALVAAPLVALLTLAPVSGALTTSAITNIANGLPFINLSLIGASNRRHRRRWGMVKNARNGLPIGGVFVELWGIAGTKIAQTLTDQSGLYGFIVETPGKYEIRVHNPLYAAYASLPLEIINPQADIVMADIMLTPLGNWQEKTGEKITRLLKFLSLLNVIYWPVLIFGSLTALYIFGQQITLINAAVVSLYVLLWSAKLLEYNYYRPFGLVVDKATDQPQAGVVVQLTAKEPGGRTRINSTITDKRGRFLFVVRPRHYHMVAAKAGFMPAEKDLIGSDINVTVKLEKARS